MCNDCPKPDYATGLEKLRDAAHKMITSSGLFVICQVQSKSQLGVYDGIDPYSFLRKLYNLIDLLTIIRNNLDNDITAGYCLDEATVNNLINNDSGVLCIVEEFECDRPQDLSLLKNLLDLFTPTSGYCDDNDQFKWIDPPVCLVNNNNHNTGIAEYEQLQRFLNGDPKEIYFPPKNAPLSYYEALPGITIKQANVLLMTRQFTNLTLCPIPPCGIIGFEFAQYNETRQDTDTIVPVNILRVGGSANVQTVTITATNGTAVTPTDYLFVSPTTVTFADGDTTTKIVNVTIKGGTNPQAAKDFTLNLTVNGCSTTAITTTDIHINDVHVYTGHNTAISQTSPYICSGNQYFFKYKTLGTFLNLNQNAGQNISQLQGWDSPIGSPNTGWTNKSFLNELGVTNLNVSTHTLNGTITDFTILSGGTIGTTDPKNNAIPISVASKNDIVVNDSWILNGTIYNTIYEQHVVKNDLDTGKLLTDYSMADNAHSSPTTGNILWYDMVTGNFYIRNLMNAASLAHNAYSQTYTITSPSGTTVTATTFSNVTLPEGPVSAANFTLPLNPGIYTVNCQSSFSGILISKIQFYFSIDLPANAPDDPSAYGQFNSVKDISIGKDASGNTQGTFVLPANTYSATSRVSQADANTQAQTTAQTAFTSLAFAYFNTPGTHFTCTKACVGNGNPIIYPEVCCSGLVNYNGTCVGACPSGYKDNGFGNCVPDISFSCNEVLHNGGTGHQEFKFFLNPLGGIIVFAINAYKVPDKFQILHSDLTATGGFKLVAGTSMSNSSTANADILNGITVPEPIGASLGTVPGRFDEFKATVPNAAQFNISRLIYNGNSSTAGVIYDPASGQFLPYLGSDETQQLIWWTYTSTDYVNGNYVKFVNDSSASDTLWTTTRLCDNQCVGIGQTSTIDTGCCCGSFAVVQDITHSYICMDSNDPVNGIHALQNKGTAFFSVFKNPADITSAVPGWYYGRNCQAAGYSSSKLFGAFSGLGDNFCRTPLPNCCGFNGTNPANGICCVEDAHYDFLNGCLTDLPACYTYVTSECQDGTNRYQMYYLAYAATNKACFPGDGSPNGSGCCLSSTLTKANVGPVKMPSSGSADNFSPGYDYSYLPACK
jgi:hypothetical protein